jgi:outer membrane murein-binding lipoprotein Lpp
MICRPALAAALGTAIVLAGCGQGPRTDRLADRMVTAEARADQLQRQIEQLQADNRRLAEQVRTLRQLGDDRLDRLFHVEQVRLGRYSGGVDLDPNTPGHEAVRVLLTPIDQHGHPIKAAGDVRIELYDLSSDPGANRLARCDIPPEELAQAWSTTLIGGHFSLDCPFAGRRPSGEQVTARVSFTDLLTGRSFETTEQLPVRPPGR